MAVTMFLDGETTEVEKRLERFVRTMAGEIEVDVAAVSEGAAAGVVGKRD